MNERIEEFYSQVGLDFENFQRVTVKKGDMEKFAKLIVRACADVGERYADGNYEVPRQILAHFGMDEDEE